MVAICFAISLFFFVRIFACKRIPKLSLIIVIIEAVVAYTWAEMIGPQMEQEDARRRPGVLHFNRLGWCL